MTDSGLGNVWLVFNVPDNDQGAHLPPYAQVAIAIVGLIALAVVTAGLRLLPAQWQFRGTPLRERTWPAVGASIVVLAVWFSRQSYPTIAVSWRTLSPKSRFPSISVSVRAESRSIPFVKTRHASS